MRGDKVFLDTNILVYAHDVSAGDKHAIALRIMEDLWNSVFGVLSTQVLEEFFVTATKKIPKPLSVLEAKEVIRVLLKWNIVINDGESLLEAIDIHLRHKYSFWDSMIIESAVRGGVSLLLSEDLSDGHTIEGVTFKNPFLNTEL